MASVGNGQAGKTLIGTGVTSSPTFASIGTSSGLTDNGVIISGGSGAFTATGPGTAGQVLQSAGASADPAYSTATYPSTAGTSGNVLTSNGTNWTSAAASGGSSYSFSYYTTSAQNPADATTYYLPALGVGAWGTSITASTKTWIPKTGTITAVVGYFAVVSTLGSAENATLQIRLNDTTNTILSSTLQFTAASNAFTFTGLSIAVTAGDFISIQLVTPSWVTNPTSVFFGATVMGS